MQALHHYNSQPAAMASQPEAPDFSGWPVGGLRRYLQERGIGSQGARAVRRSNDGGGESAGLPARQEPDNLSLSSAGVVERGELLALAEAAAAGTPPEAHQPQAAAASARPAAEDPRSFADTLVQSLIQSTDNPRLIAAVGGHAWRNHTKLWDTSRRRCHQLLPATQCVEAACGPNQLGWGLLAL